MMTSRERLLKALKGEQTDRVPVTLFMLDQGHFLEQVYPEVDPFDYEQLQLKVIEIQKQLGVDVFVRMLFGINDPIGVHCGGLNVSEQTENWKVTKEKIQQGDTTVIRSKIETPEGDLTQDFSINRLRASTYMYGCTKFPIQNKLDLEIASKYEPPLMNEQKARMIKKRVSRIKQALGEDGILGSWTPHGPFNNSSLLTNHEQLYSLFIVDYEFYEKLMNFAMNRIVDYTRAIDNAGVDVHCVGGNVPGGFLGKKCYDEYVLPFEKKYIDFVQANGTPAMYHNCGEIMNLVESYKHLGAKIIEPFSPPPLGDADLKKAKEIVNGDYVMLAGVDQVNVLQKGSVEDVKRITEETIRIGKPGGKFILQSADFLEYGTPMENLEAYVQTALQFADY
ncbi:uroporphyrinogen decarboxylase family protein [Sedimentisphaera salicampi]|uniref:Methylcobalamin:coenzyme M methyltransferase n=1 Tax=Sedimentisphaera salicampi TaxID=1941349 RepID=A0A1W6LQG3_9BACT|nr:uroporphyrinogen decarboxylase family protein [Sedimentisphaera salicampi]ARN57991.1 methylcobalamin:coenzyme M methyltransferase [Sedimentisphaera salicampi]OXU14156.1 methylcobalamin:coenzyme M methyltransferase [Sedimentisphaera salicampi]